MSLEPQPRTRAALERGAAEPDHRLVQRALVIALHDPGFAADVAARPAATLGPLGLGPVEQAALARLDPRACATDPLRARRVLRTLADEYRASTTLLLDATGAMAGLDGFFASARFRDAIMRDRALAVAFGEHLAEAAAALGRPLLHGVVTLELARARCRRAAHAAPRPGIGLAPGVAVLALDAAVLPAVQAVERWLFEIGLMPQIALAADRPPLPALAPAGGAPEHYLVQPEGGHVSITPIDADLHRVLAALAEPRPRDAAARAAGVPAAVLDALAAEGMLAAG